MKLGVYNAIFHDRPLDEALKDTRELGLTGLELNTGGFLPPVHIPNYEQILESDTARDEYLGIFEAAGVQLAGLNCNGNPLHPDPLIGREHSESVLRSIRLAERLGQTRVVTMSGLPAGEPGGVRANWVVNAWNSAALDVLDYQWGVAAKFWREADALAQDLGVKVALELHPQNLVFNPATFYELLDKADTKNIGVELDASHLFWQLMDPVAVVHELGSHVLHAAAKDIRINPRAAINGVLDNSFTKAPRETAVNLGGDEWANVWPKDSSWDFVAVGKGHDAEYWAQFIIALYNVDSNMLLNIEHEDQSMGRIEGLAFARNVLRDASRIAGVTL